MPDMTERISKLEADVEVIKATTGRMDSQLSLLNRLMERMVKLEEARKTSDSTIKRIFNGLGNLETSINGIQDRIGKLESVKIALTWILTVLGLGVSVFGVALVQSL